MTVSTRPRTRHESMLGLLHEINGLFGELQSFSRWFLVSMAKSKIPSDVPTLDYARVEVRNARERLRAARTQIDPGYGENEGQR